MPPTYLSRRGKNVISQVCNTLDINSIFCVNSSTKPKCLILSLCLLLLTLLIENVRNTIEFQRKLGNRRKRQTSSILNDSPDFQKAIEIAVFVDDDLYYKTEQANPKNPIEEIQNLVFAYLNSVSF